MSGKYLLHVNPADRTETLRPTYIFHTLGMALAAQTRLAAEGVRSRIYDI